MRISQGCLLLLSKPMDAGNRAPLVSPLELVWKRGQGHYRHLLYQLRHSRTVSQWQEPGDEGICVSSSRHGGHVWKLSAAGKGFADDGGPSPVLGCSVYFGNAYCQWSERWQGCSNRRDQDRRDFGNARSDG